MEERRMEVQIETERALQQASRDLHLITVRNVALVHGKNSG